MEFINNSQDNFHQELVELIKISMTQIVQRFFLSFLFFFGFWGGGGVGGGGGRVYNFTMLKIKDFASHSRKFLKFHMTISKLNHILT